jgi:hypothetical protein
MSQDFTLQMFSEQLNTKFRMHYAPSKTAEIELIKVRDLGSTPRHTQFSCIFLAPPDVPIFQSIYKVEHDRLGSLDLFLVPTGKDDTGVQYEAIFNRFHDE